MKLDEGNKKKSLKVREAFRSLENVPTFPTFTPSKNNISTAITLDFAPLRASGSWPVRRKRPF